MKRILLAVPFLLSPVPASSETYLLMAEEKGCHWCERWDQEISGIYPKTEEGKIAPLKRYDLHADEPDVEFKMRVHYTPTFILVSQGEEVGRLEGYPGEDFFWALITAMIDKAGLKKTSRAD